MGITEDFAPYRDQWGLYQDQPGRATGNGILYTAHAMVAGVATHFDFSAVWDPHTQCLTRWPGCKDQEGPDDYFGIGTIAKLQDPSIARTILLYGNLTYPRYVYNNVEPRKFSWSAWMGRFPALIAHLQFAAGEDPGIGKKLWWCISVLLNVGDALKNQDAYIFAWHMCTVAEGKSWPCDQVIKFWRKQFLKKCPGGVGQILKDYFATDDNNPYVKWLWGHA